MLCLKLKDKGPLVKAKVLSEAGRPRSYRILAENGTVYERNRRVLQRSSSKYLFQVRKSSNDVESHSKNSPTSPVSSSFCLSPVSESDPAPVKRTRFGREVRPQSYRKDYVSL